MPTPQLNLITGRLTYERATDRDDSQAIYISNTGGGFLYGTAHPSVSWIEVTKHVRCAPGQQQQLEVVIDAGQLVPGETHRGQVDIQASGAQSATIPVEVRVPPPQVTISPMQINLGTIRRKDLFTARGSFEIRNNGPSRAICHISKNPRWLVLDPVRFDCLPGQTQTVELIGRIDQLPAQETRHKALLSINIAGRNPRQVEVMVQEGTGAQAGRRAVEILAIGCAGLILLGAIVWFLVWVIPQVF
jgi:hypothetical protein